MLLAGLSDATFEGQYEGEGRTLAKFRFDRDRTFHSLYDYLAQCQSQTMSVLVGLGILGYIGKEDGVEVLFSNAITCVANKKLNLFVVVKEAITKLYTTFFSMFDRIAYQIAQHLCQSVGVGVEDNLLVGLVTSHLHQ